MAEPAQGAASPEAARRKGARKAQGGDYAGALRWLERAVRLAPADPRIALDLANIRLLAGGHDQIARAGAAFAALASRYGTSACRLGLLAARRLAGDHAGAAESLHDLLSRHCVPEDVGFPAVAATIAEAAGIPGWCGMDASGRLHFSLPLEQIETLIDGAPVALTHLTPLPDCAKLVLLSGGKNLLGSPIDLAVLRRCEGIVETAGAALSGWVSRPSAPQTPLQLVLQDARGRRRNIALSGVLADADAPLTTRHKFHCPWQCCWICSRRSGCWGRTALTFSAARSIRARNLPHPRFPPKRADRPTSCCRRAPPSPWWCRSIAGSPSPRPASKPSCMRCRARSG
jgi:hypothetical protein